MQIQLQRHKHVYTLLVGSNGLSVLYEDESCHTKDVTNVKLWLDFLLFLFSHNSWWFKIQSNYHCPSSGGYCFHCLARRRHWFLCSCIYIRLKWVSLLQLPVEVVWINSDEAAWEMDVRRQRYVFHVTFTLLWYPIPLHVFTNTFNKQ